MKQDLLTSALQTSATKKQAQPAGAKPRKSSVKKAEEAPRGGRGNKVQVAGWFAPEVGRTLKFISVEQNTTNQALIEEGLRAVFKRYGKPWPE